MYLVDSHGRHTALVFERPITPSTLDAAGLGYRVAMSAPCQRCGELTIREHCAVHVGAVVPHDRSGGYFSPWVLRCRTCFVRSMAEMWRLVPE